MQLLPPQMYSKQRLLPGYRLLAQLGHAVAEEASHAVNGAGGGDSEATLTLQVAPAHHH